KNVQIYNSTNIGLLAIHSAIDGENMVINNSGQSSLAIQLGGSYTFRHCTFANYWTEGFRSFPTVVIANYAEYFDGSSTVTEVLDLIAANFTNCIIYGNERREFGLLKDDQAIFNFKFENSLVHFEDPTGEFSNDPLYDFTNAALYPETKFNIDPVFQDTELNNFNIESGTSGADGIGKPGVLPTEDLNGTTRGNSQLDPPDAGAYESIEF
ncbi:MAG: hypothetical protein KDC64_07040, partial [Aequorivita sp.]|nr:hypothetical protein [Aequorivita sp.]